VQLQEAVAVLAEVQSHQAAVVDDLLAQLLGRVHLGYELAVRDELAVAVAQDKLSLLLVLSELDAALVQTDESSQSDLEKQELAFEVLVVIELYKLEGLHNRLLLGLNLEEVTDFELLLEQGFGSQEFRHFELGLVFVHVNGFLLEHFFLLGGEVFE